MKLDSCPSSISSLIFVSVILDSHPAQQQSHWNGVQRRGTHKRPKTQAQREKSEITPQFFYFFFFSFQKRANITVSNTDYQFLTQKVILCIYLLVHALHSPALPRWEHKQRDIQRLPQWSRGHLAGLRWGGWHSVDAVGPHGRDYWPPEPRQPAAQPQRGSSRYWIIGSVYFTSCNAKNTGTIQVTWDDLGIEIVCPAWPGASYSLSGWIS